jgi:hypothetical protein
MAVERNNRKIKNLLINFAVQQRIIVVNLLFMILVLLLTMAIIYTHLYEMEVNTKGVWYFPLGELTMSFSVKLIILYALLVITFIVFLIFASVWQSRKSQLQ